ncbi:hypothetical protein BDC45DRAFT_326850 [Circinella umbellata]|nr:hypothetical protein BDC45DRAFT_326850 [Circinella umbellata]
MVIRKVNNDIRGNLQSSQNSAHSVASETSSNESSQELLYEEGSSPWIINKINVSALLNKMRNTTIEKMNIGDECLSRCEILSSNHIYYFEFCGLSDISNYLGLHDQTLSELHEEMDDSDSLVSLDEDSYQACMIFEDKNDTFYTVQSIVDHKQLSPGKYEYRVRWKGYTINDDTWEPAESFNSPQPIMKYWERIGVLD